MTPQEVRRERRGNNGVHRINDRKLTSSKDQISIFCTACIWSGPRTDSSAQADHIISSHEHSPRHAFWTGTEWPNATWDEVRALSAWKDGPVGRD